MDEIQEQVVAAIAEITEKEISEITLNSRLYDDLEMDSLNGMELLTRLSQQYNISIPEEKLLEISTVGDVVTLIKENVQG